MRATKHAPRDPFSVLERRHGLAEIVERGALVFVERPNVNPIDLTRPWSNGEWNEWARRDE